MEKPTAQELWARIEEEMAKLPELQEKIMREQSTPTLYFIASQRIQNLQKYYAQTYHEEQMRDFVGIPQGEFTCAFLDRINAGLIKLKTYPPNPQPND
jgi:hypothetical protein